MGYCRLKGGCKFDHPNISSTFVLFTTSMTFCVCHFLMLERFLFQRAECNLNFDLYKIVFCFQIHKSIPIIEHNKMKPKKFSTQGWFNPQLGTLCCNWGLGKYHDVENSHLVTDYEHNLSLLN